MPLELGYWNVRGLAGGIRVLLDFCDAKWSEIHYEVYPQEDDGLGLWNSKWSLKDWTDKKESDEFQQNFDFPNLPWLKDGDVKITQSTAIYKVCKFFFQNFRYNQKTVD